MLAPLNPATRTRRIVAELLVVALVAALLTVAYRIDREWISRHVTQLNLWPGPDAGAWSTRGRGLLVLLATIVVLGLRPWLISIAPKLTLAGLGRSAVPVLLALTPSAFTLEGFLRWMEARGRPPRMTHQQRGTRHPRYGWTWQPSQTGTERIAGREIHWAFNREGIRVHSQDDEPSAELPTILFTGESIAAGQGLDYAETYPALIAAHRSVQCVNLGTNAYGSDQAYLRLIDAIPRFPRLLATVTVFLPAQLSRNLQDDKPRLVLGPAGQLEPVPAATDFLSRLRIRKLFRNDLPYLGDPAIDRTLTLTSAILRQTSANTQARGATPLFVVPSYGPQRTLDEHPEAWILRALFVQQRLAFILVDIPQDQLLNGDPHPGPRGEERIAAAIEAALPARLPAE